ncbi:hypothetical protein WOLCODRAFT_26984 [Wolfiporia cocos MD-104 SS10]|uniref:Uncharacterized protein n=1 Tax=Wolfiporia cocos (strain MD-104) TaxID=742152 RepID=A0A2H3JT30_WOLCO|nr:hypothetical protein WOLCODRAFT_26984 [Wolfiporia cocos MD-104 SS10]
MSPCEVVEKNGWGPRHRHRHVRHTVRIGVRNARWLGFRQQCQTAPYLRAHLAALERGNIGLKRRGSYFAFAYRSLGTCLARW